MCGPEMSSFMHIYWSASKLCSSNFQMHIPYINIVLVDPLKCETLPSLPQINETDLYVNFDILLYEEVLLNFQNINFY